MKKKFLLSLTLILVLFVAITSSIFAYYKYKKSFPGSKFTLSNIVFSLNGNTSNENEFFVKGTQEMCIGDGYALDFDLAIAGQFVAEYAADYSVSFEYSLEDGQNDLIYAIEVYKKVGEKYEYVSMLDAFLQNSITGYLGSNDVESFSYLLVYAQGANTYYEGKDFSFKMIATSNTVSTSGTDFPYYYLGASGNYTIEQVFDQIAQSGIVEDKTIVLTHDMILDKDVTFRKKVGIDLNGHTLNLNGHTLKIEYSESYEEDKDVMLTNSLSTGGVEGTGSIVVNASKDILKISDSFPSDKLAVTVTENGLSTMGVIFNQRLDTLSKNVLNSNKEYSIIEDYEYYFTNNKISMSISDALCQSSIVNHKIVFPEKEYTDSYQEYYTISSGSNSATFDGTFTIQGTSTYELANMLLSNLPNKISHNLFLTTYLPEYQANVTWVSSNSKLINKEGIFLPSGYAVLDSWLNQRVSLGVIVEINGQRESLSKEVEVEILSLEERTNLFYDYSQLIFSIPYDPENPTADYDWKSLDVATMLLSKYNTSSQENVMDILLDKYGIEGSTFDEKIQAFIEKLGIVSISANIADAINIEDGNLKYLSKETNTINNVECDKLWMIYKPTSASVVFTVPLAFTYYVEEGKLNQDTFELDRVATIVAQSSFGQAVDLTQELRRPFLEYDSISQEKVKVGDTITDVYNKYDEEFFIRGVASTGVTVHYEVEEEFKDYVSIRYKEDTEGNYNTLNTSSPYVYISTSMVPQKTTTVRINATVDGSDVVYELEFDCVGILHNSDEDISDGALYVELIKSYDLNHDGILTILEAQNENITDCNFASKGISNVKGIEFFTGIQVLNLSGNQIVDISQLENLHNLTTLNLANNHVSSINSIQYLDSLTNIDLGGNAITDIEALRYLENIKRLDISNNKILSLSSLQDKSLDYVYVYGNVDGNGDSTIENLNSTIACNNAYYLTLLYVNNNKVKIYNLNANNTMAAPTAEEQIGAKIMRSFQELEETYLTFQLPTVYKDKDASYALRYFVDDTGKKYINFTEDSNKVITAHKISSPIVDTNIDITIEVSKIPTSGGSYNFSTIKRTFKIKSLQDTLDTSIAWIEIASGFFAKASDLIEDKNLISILFQEFNTNETNATVTGTQVTKNGTFIKSGVQSTQKYVITFDELTANKTLDLSNSGIENLTGLRWFTGIQSLNIAGNIIKENENGDPDIEELSYLVNLQELTMNGQRYNYDQLLEYSKYGIVNQTEQLILEKSFEGVEFESLSVSKGLTGLHKLYVYGSYSLDEEEVLNSLYHVYKVNSYKNNNNQITSVEIYKDSNTDKWNPFKEPLIKMVNVLPSGVVFIDLYNSNADADNSQAQLVLNKNYNFYFYDDIEPVTFSTNNKGIVGYNDSKSCVTTSISGNYFYIRYNTLCGFTDVLYQSVELKATSKINGRDISSEAQIQKTIEIKLEFNWKITFDGQSLDSIFTGRKLRTIVMKNISNMIKNNALDANGITLVNSTTDKYHFYHVTQTTFSNVTPAAARMTIDMIGDVNNAIDGVHDSGGNSIGGLQYLTKIQSVAIYRDGTVGNGVELKNIKTLTLQYSMVDLSNLSIVLENLTSLTLQHNKGLVLGSYSTNDASLTGPGSVIDSYMKWMPNLTGLTIKGESNNNCTIYNYTFLMGYSYLPEEATTAIDYKGDIVDFTGDSYLYTYNSANNEFRKVAQLDNENFYKLDDTGAITSIPFEKNENTKYYRRLSQNKITSYTETGIPGGYNYASYERILDLMFLNSNTYDESVAGYNASNVNYSKDKTKLYTTEAYVPLANNNVASVFSPTEALEYKEFAPYISDYELKVNDNYYYNSTVTGIYNSGIKITIPEKLSSFVGVNENADKTGNYFNFEANEYRQFAVSWYVLFTGSIDTMKQILGERALSDPQTTNGITKAKLSPTYLSTTVGTPDYDTYFIIEGVIGETVGNKKYSCFYPFLIKGTNINASTTISYRNIEDNNLRIALFYLFGSNGTPTDICGQIPVDSISKLTELSIDANYEKSMQITGKYNNKNFTLKLDSLSKTSSLSSRLAGIISIKGIESLTSLTSLSIINTNLTDITPIRTMSALTKIDFTNNQIANIACLKDLTGLKEAILKDNCVSVVSSTGSILNTLDVLNLENNITFTKEALNTLTTNMNNRTGSLSLNIKNTSIVDGKNNIFEIDSIQILNQLSQKVTTFKLTSTGSEMTIPSNGLSSIITNYNKVQTANGWVFAYTGEQKIPSLTSYGANMSMSYLNTYIYNNGAFNTNIANNMNHIISNMKITDQVTLNGNNVSISYYQNVDIGLLSTATNYTLKIGSETFIQSDNVLDYDLFAYFIANIGTTGIRQIDLGSAEVTSDLTTLNLENCGIRSLKGIQKLTALTSLTVSYTGNSLKSLGISSLPASLKTIRLNTYQVLSDGNNLMNILANLTGITDVDLKGVNGLELKNSLSSLGAVANKANIYIPFEYNLFTYGTSGSYSYSSKDGSAIAYEESLMEIKKLYEGVSFHGSITAASEKVLGITQKYIAGDKYTSYNTSKLNHQIMIYCDKWYYEKGSTTFTSDNLHYMSSYTADNFTKYVSNVGTRNSRPISLQVVNGETYYLPLRYSLNGFTYPISFNATYSENASYLTNNPTKGCFSVSQNATTVEFKLSINSKETTLNIISSTNTPETNDDVQYNYLVELSNKEIVSAYDVFDSPRLIRWIFVDSSINSKKDNLLSQTEILNTTSFLIKASQGITSIRGIEIFVNLRDFQIAETAFIDISPLSNLHLKSFTYNDISLNYLIMDFSPLNNSRDTLTSFHYSSKGVNANISFEDFSFFMGFGEQLTNIEIKGFKGIENTLSFQYFVAWEYINRPNTVIKLNDVVQTVSNNIKKAANILALFDGSDSTMIYANNFELFFHGDYDTKQDVYTASLPLYIDNGGTFYKIEWSSMSSFIVIQVFDKNGNEITAEDYALIKDYNIYKDYTVQISLSNKDYNLLNYARILAKVEIDGYNTFTKNDSGEYVYAKISEDTYEFILKTEAIAQGYEMLEKNKDSQNIEYYSNNSSNAQGFDSFYINYYYERMLTINCNDFNHYSQIAFESGYASVALPTSYDGTLITDYTLSSNSGLEIITFGDSKLLRICDANLAKSGTATLTLTLKNGKEIQKNIYFDQASLENSKNLILLNSDLITLKEEASDYAHGIISKLSDDFIQSMGTLSQGFTLKQISYFDSEMLSDINTIYSSYSTKKLDYLNLLSNSYFENENKIDPMGSSTLENIYKDYYKRIEKCSTEIDARSLYLQGKEAMERLTNQVIVEVSIVSHDEIFFYDGGTDTIDFSHILDEMMSKYSEIHYDVESGQYYNEDLQITGWNITGGTLDGSYNIHLDGNYVKVSAKIDAIVVQISYMYEGKALITERSVSFNNDGVLVIPYNNEVQSIFNSVTYYTNEKCTEEFDGIVEGTTMTLYTNILPAIQLNGNSSTTYLATKFVQASTSYPDYAVTSMRNTIKGTFYSENKNISENEIDNTYVVLHKTLTSGDTYTYGFYTTKGYIQAETSGTGTIPFVNRPNTNYGDQITRGDVNFYLDLSGEYTFTNVYYNNGGILNSNGGLTKYIRTEFYTMMTNDNTYPASSITGGATNKTWVRLNYYFPLLWNNKLNIYYIQYTGLKDKTLKITRSDFFEAYNKKINSPSQDGKASMFNSSYKSNPYVNNTIDMDYTLATSGSSDGSQNAPGTITLFYSPIGNLNVILNPYITGTPTSVGIANNKFSYYDGGWKSLNNLPDSDVRYVMFVIINTDYETVKKTFFNKQVSPKAQPTVVVAPIKKRKEDF